MISRPVALPAVGTKGEAAASRVKVKRSFCRAAPRAEMALAMAASPGSPEYVPLAIRVSSAPSALVNAVKNASAAACAAGVPKVDGLD